MTGPDRGEIATDCDKCAAPIPYGVTCFAVPTGEVWEGDDEDAGKPVVEIVCGDCYRKCGPVRRPSGRW